MSGIIGYLMGLEFGILFINVFGLVGSTLNWSWLKWDQQLEKISNLSVSQSNELDAKNVGWLKTILSWIVGARFVIDRVLLLAYGANIYTIITRSWQNLLIFWMVLSFLKDIVLEIVVIVIIFLLWHTRNVPTSLFVEFIVEKTMHLFFTTYKWCTTLKWHTQLRKVEKIRNFAIIARRSIANIAHVSGKVRISLEDEYLSPATARRNKYASLLNLDALPDELFGRVNFNLRASKSLTTLATDDSHESNDTNNHDPIANDLSVAEKSMRMLNITAEDVMDARARIQERPYWNEQDATSEAMEEVVAQFSLEKVEEEISDADRTLKEEDTARDYQTEKERKKDDIKGSLTDSEGEILSGKQKEDILLAKNGTRRETKKEAERAVKVVQCPSSEENAEAKPCASFIRELRAKLRSVNQREKEIDQKTHRCRVKTKSTSTSSSSNKEEFDKSPETSCACDQASRNIYTSKDARSIDINDKNIKHDVDKKEFKHFVSIGIAQKGKGNECNSTLKYSEIYRLKREREKQIEKSEDSLGKQSITWESMSLARTAHISGYVKNIVATDKISSTETSNESSDTLNARRRLKYIEYMQNEPSIDLRSIFKVASLRRKNYAESEANDLALVENKRGTRSLNRKLSIEEREAVERSALRIYNKFTLLEDKKELEARKTRDLSSNHKQTIKLSETNVSGADNDSWLRKKRARRHNLMSPSCEQPIEESSALKARNQLAENTRVLQAGKIHNSMKYETSSEREEDVDASSVSNHFSEANHENTTISSSGTHRSANARTLLNLREITRNIEWTVHPRGITLINKNLCSQFLETGRFQESRQRDIVDDDTANTLHSAFFFKPEITMRIFRHVQTSIGESSPNIPTFLREDFDTEFVCRVSNEMIVRDRFSFFDLDFERMMGDQSNLENSHNSENRVVEEEEDRDLCIIFVDPEQIHTELESRIENSIEVTGRRENAHSSTANIQSTSILTFDKNHEKVDNGTSDNLSVQSIIDGLKSFCVEVEESVYNTTSPAEQSEGQGNMSNAIGENGFRAQKSISKTKNINRIIENSSALSFPGPSSFMESNNDNTLTLKSSEEKFQKSTQLSDSETTLENRRSKSTLNLRITDDTILQFDVTQNNARSENNDKEMIYEKANELPTHRFFRMSSAEKLQQDDSFYSAYDRNDNKSNTPVSLEHGSLMEEFSNDIILSGHSSDSFNNNS